MAFLDSGFFVAYSNKGDEYHQHAQDLFADILNGRVSMPHTCDYVLNEAVNTVWTRTKDMRIASSLCREMTNPKYWTLHHVSKECVEWCVEQYAQNSTLTLSFTDWVVIWMAREKMQDTMITTDAPLAHSLGRWKMKTILLVRNDE